MKSAETICRDLKSIDGVVGAFVLGQSECLATSLPPQYDLPRLVQVGGVIRRISQMCQRAGIERCANVFHWQRASLLTWPFGDDSLLAILTSPHAVREAVDLSASTALAELTKSSAPRPAFNPSLRPTKTSAETAAANEQALTAAIAPRLERLEQLLVEELGASGKSLMERCLRRVARPTMPLGPWLLELRKAVLSEVTDPTARVTIAMSVDWADTD